nr:PREDICTED: receptor-type tyrosine-protein phosphatase eta-like isoform X1 [Lepisosteus oculatus]
MKVPLLLAAALWISGLAERQYFLQSNGSEWEVALEHCRLCFQDLVTVTTDNIPILARNLTNNTWIGLRNDLDGPMEWTNWSNGDPLTFQNWYPGRPSMNDTREVCIHFLPSGLWYDETCDQLYPYICYADRFYGNLSVFNISEHNAYLSWTPGPGMINQYRVEVTGNTSQVHNTTNLTLRVDSLTPGSLYKFQVFPVKCERVLNPENASIYTKPECVTNLAVSSQTQNLIALTWSAPIGNRDKYRVEVDSEGVTNFTALLTVEEQVTVRNLTPGGFYTFQVIALVADCSIEGDPVNISAFTRPGAVRNAEVSESRAESVNISWSRPVGNSSWFRVEVQEVQVPSPGPCYKNSTIVSDLSVVMSGLTPGSKYNFTIVAFIPNTTLEGDPVWVVGYTVPDPVTNVNTLTTSDSITVLWGKPANGSYFSYEVTLDGCMECGVNTSWLNTTFQNLKSGKNYTITIFTHVEDYSLPSNDVKIWAITRPVKPGNITFQAINLHNVSLTWEVPEKLQGVPVQYCVNYSTSFWGYGGVKVVSNNSATVESLTSGTKYIFSVQTLVSDLPLSEATVGSVYTVPKIKKMGLIMQCTSNKILECEKVQKAAIEKAREMIQRRFGDGVFWKLNWQKNPNL